MSNIKKYTVKDLKFIAHILNKVSATSNKTNGAEMNTYHFSRFYSRNHYIDHHTRYGFKVYKKYKGWEADDEILSISSWRKT